MDGKEYQDAEQARVRRKQVSSDEATKYVTGESKAVSQVSPMLQSLAGKATLNGYGNRSTRIGAMRQAQKIHGNRAVQRAMSGQVVVQRIGWQRPDGDDLSPYLYLNWNKSGWGVDYGAGFAGNDRTDILSFNGSTGLIEDDKGNISLGIRGSGGILRHIIDATDAKGEFGVGTADFDWSIGDEGASFGGGASAVEASYTGGKADPSSKSDEILHGGFSIGPGLAFRTHWSDEDKDNELEYGAGFDAGPVSFDYKTEFGGPSEPRRGGEPEDLSPTPDSYDPNAPNKSMKNHPFFQMFRASTDGITNAGRKAINWLSNW
jgi:hypothetical protein